MCSLQFSWNLQWLFEPCELCAPVMVVLTLWHFPGHTSVFKGAYLSLASPFVLSPWQFHSTHRASLSSPRCQQIFFMSSETKCVPCKSFCWESPWFGISPRSPPVDSRKGTMLLLLRGRGSWQGWGDPRSWGRCLLDVHFSKWLSYCGEMMHLTQFHTLFLTALPLPNNLPFHLVVLARGFLRAVCNCCTGTHSTHHSNWKVEKV